MILGAKPWQGLKRQLQQLLSPWLFFGGGGAALLAPCSFQITITAAARQARSIPGAITDLFNKTPWRGINLQPEVLFMTPTPTTAASVSPSSFRGNRGETVGPLLGPRQVGSPRAHRWPYPADL